ncbi:MAG TPA: GNAT family N-acetyltransferase [Acidimicrobiia bacterium]|nr:GNAT family N-acetyltransferase [Acidimicrobiia bacterium]
MSEAGAPVEIRHAERRDAAGIMAVYNRFVTDSTALFDLVPRTLDEQVAWIDEHSGGHPALVAVAPDAPDDVPGGIVGFGSLSPFRTRPAYAGTVENSVYLLDAFQRRGIGRRMLDELVALAKAHGFHTVIARISGGNDGSIALHAACGYEIVGIEREVGRKFGQWLDVVEMQRML